MDAFHPDAVRYDTGYVNSSLGVRLDLVSAADDAFLAHPWLGVGVGNFGGYLETTPDCVESPAAFCRFDHAHSDLPEWAATMGIPGLLAILALYGVPLLLFARRLRGAGRCSASAPCAGVLFVATFALCGLTQSMFAHQLSASFYAVMVGLLAGFCRCAHAHGDLPGWAGTRGVPGLLAILARYGGRLLLFARRLRGAGRCSASAPCAGVLFVATFGLCGLTQSMFAHQLSASFYAVMVGLLAGFCMTGRVGERTLPGDDLGRRSGDGFPTSCTATIRDMLTQRPYRDLWLLAVVALLVMGEGVGLRGSWPAREPALGR